MRFLQQICPTFAHPGVLSRREFTTSTVFTQPAAEAGGAPVNLDGEHASTSARVHERCKAAKTRIGHPKKLRERPRTRHERLPSPKLLHTSAERGSPRERTRRSN